jgi:ribosomal protein L33
MAQIGKTIKVLLRSTAKHPKDPKRTTGATYVATRPTSAPKLEGVVKFDNVIRQHVEFKEVKAKN